MWYYTLNNQQVGPVDEKEIKKLVDSGVINQATMLWTNGMAGWAPISQTPLASLNGGRSSSASDGGICRPVCGRRSKSGEDEEAFHVVLDQPHRDPHWTLVLSLRLSYSSSSFTSPGSSCSTMKSAEIRTRWLPTGFIPGWNFYWYFPAFGTGEGIERPMDKANMTAERINLDMVTWMLICLYGASVTFGIIHIAFIVLWVMYTNKVKNAYNALLCPKK